MKQTVRKLVVGRGPRPDEQKQSTITHRVENLKAIWDNAYEEDAGLEKFVRLLLAASQFIFPGMYIKHLLWRKGRLYQDFAVELFVLLKTVFPIAVMVQGWAHERWALVLIAWFMLETLLYIPTLIFASDHFTSPRSYRRSKLLIFINYMEVVFSFAVIHLSFGYFNQPFHSWKDAVYASFMITSTIGFGEYYPVTGLGKLMVSLQSVFYISYIALFISVINLGSNKGYFGDVGRK